MRTISIIYLILALGLLFISCSFNSSNQPMNTSQAAATQQPAATARPSPIDFTVKDPIPKIKQPTDMTCWAASATMMQSWKDKATLKIIDVMTKAGNDFKSKFQANKGLLGSEKPFFLQALGLKAEPPQNYTVAGWLRLLQAHGPLWVTTNEGTTQNFAIHARILKGIAGDGSPDATFLTFIDPASGLETSESVTVFTKKIEDIAKLDLGSGADIRPQVVHF
ncbi:MAG TPA: papain-like cysteine protease family protein [Pyrinomonadaceae bacterium]